MPAMVVLDYRLDVVSNNCPVVFSCDGVYAMQLATALRSLVEANPGSWPVEVYVLYNELSDRMRNKVLDSLPEGSASVLWIPVDLEIFTEFSSYMGISKIFYSRLLIGHLAPATVKRVLYLDTDVLVLDDLGALWETDLNGAAIGAVLDGLDPTVTRIYQACEGVPVVSNYFNSGVLIIDLSIWRSDRIGERALEYLDKNRESRFPDQNALNIVCDGKWKQLHGRWNYQNHHRTRILEMPPNERPAIVHFVTSQKPWVPRYLSMNAALYNSFRNKTRFARTLSEVALDAFTEAWCRSKRLARKIRFTRLMWKAAKNYVANAPETRK